jgi:hypothetical protein
MDARWSQRSYHEGRARNRLRNRKGARLSRCDGHDSQGAGSTSGQGIPGPRFA